MFLADRQAHKKERKKERTSYPEMIAASDFASWAFCRESWRLSRIAGEEPANTAQRRAGQRHHTRWRLTHMLTRALTWIGAVLIMAAAVMLWMGAGR